MKLDKAIGEKYKMSALKLKIKYLHLPRSRFVESHISQWQYMSAENLFEKEQKVVDFLKTASLLL